MSMLRGSDRQMVWVLFSLSQGYSSDLVLSIYFLSFLQSNSYYYKKWSTQI